MEPLSGDARKYRLPDHASQKTVMSPVQTPNTEEASYFNPFGRRRTDSVYSLSRVSFSTQIGQLTSLQLPPASSLSTSISSIPTSAAAVKALAGAAEQIKRWITKASDVLQGLDAEDDVEWAAAGGREGLGDVETAIFRFESLIEIYVAAIEELQGRGDIVSVPSAELKGVVEQMDRILGDWDSVRRLQKGVKQQVEMAMEWEELWNIVLGEIGQEIEALSGLVFEMEEARHMSAPPAAATENGIDIGELETIVEDSPVADMSRPTLQNRYSLASNFPMSSPVTPREEQGGEDSNLLALFARMQPLRASLDFLPMRLSEFNSRAVKIFPTACEELRSRKLNLEEQWQVLEKDADSLRRELGEDRWITVFRNAGRQAQKMCDSVHRSIGKLRESLESSPINNPTIAKKIESYESKKLHYGPAIERVLAIIGRGVKDRLTINGEIIRLNEDTNSRWRQIEEEMKELDVMLDDYNVSKSQQLRDSVSSIISMDRSIILGTPGSSPASSVVQLPSSPSTPHMNGKSRPMSTFTPQLQHNSSHRSNRRYCSLPPGGAGSSLIPRASPGTPSAKKTPTSSSSTIDNRPPWRYVSTLNSSPLGYQALKSSESSSRRSVSSKLAHPRPASRGSHIPTPSMSSTASGGIPFSPTSPAVNFPTPPPSNRSSLLTTNGSRALHRSNRNPSASPARSSRSSVDSPRPLLRKQTSSSTISERRRSGLYETASLEGALDGEDDLADRRAALFEASQGSPSARAKSSLPARAPSSMAVAGAVSAMARKASMPRLRNKTSLGLGPSKSTERPPWR